MILARIQLSIPKFAINVGGIFNPQLESLGMKLAFTNKAQFADITEQNNIKLDKFIQQCRFVIDEKGSEASAAAAATMSTKSAFIANQILTVRIDRPFIFLLRDKSQNLILMTGKITNPQKI
jgi:serpin B